MFEFAKGLNDFESYQLKSIKNKLVPQHIIYNTAETMHKAFEFKFNKI